MKEMKNKLKIKQLAIPGMAFFIIFIITFIIIMTHTWNLFSKYNLIELLFRT
jgi:hypothetical protein